MTPEVRNESAVKRVRHGRALTCGLLLALAIACFCTFFVAESAMHPRGFDTLPDVRVPVQSTTLPSKWFWIPVQFGTNHVGPTLLASYFATYHYSGDLHYFHSLEVAPFGSDGGYFDSIGDFLTHRDVDAARTFDSPLHASFFIPAAWLEAAITRRRVRLSQRETPTMAALVYMVPDFRLPATHVTKASDRTRESQRDGEP